MGSPCEIYLVRHAIAAERGEEWPDDDKRPLTERGISRFKEGVKGLEAFDVELDEIFTSGLVRAKQTADLLAAGVRGKPAVKLLDALAPGHSPATWPSILSSRPMTCAMPGLRPSSPAWCSCAPTG